MYFLKMSEKVLIDEDGTHPDGISENQSKINQSKYESFHILITIYV